MPKKLKNKIPARQAMQYTIERASKALGWLAEIEKEWQKKKTKNKDCYLEGSRMRILSDIISVYVSTLVEENGSGHSLSKSYESHDFVEKFKALPIVSKCQKNRNNRSGHESKSYGHFVSSQEILNSNLKDWLDEAGYFICVVPAKQANKCKGTAGSATFY